MIKNIISLFTSFSLGICVAFLSILCCCFGCTSAHNSFTSGTSASLGAYLPANGQLYGVTLISYLNGTKVISTTNSPLTLTHSSVSNNSWLYGLFDSYTTNYTTISTSPKQKTTQ